MEAENSTRPSVGEGPRRVRIVLVDPAEETSTAQQVRPLPRNAETGTLQTFDAVVRSIASSEEYALDLGKRAAVTSFCRRLASSEIKATGRLVATGKRQAIDGIEWPEETRAGCAATVRAWLCYLRRRRARLFRCADRVDVTSGKSRPDKPGAEPFAQD